MLDKPWQQYFEEFQARAARVPPDAFSRAELLYEAAHDAYQRTTDYLTEAGWDEEDALTVTRLFGQVVKGWVSKGSSDWSDLREELKTRYADWTGPGEKPRQNA